MSKAWEVFKESLPAYLCQSENSLYVKENNILVAKSGVNSVHCNFAIIENQNEEIQKTIISKYFDCDGLIFTPEHYKPSVEKWAAELGFHYFGKFPIMHKQQERVQINKKFYDNIRVERVVNGKTLNDFIRVFSETRGINFDDGKKIFPNDLPTSIYFCYIIYYLDKPAGIFIAINLGLGGIIADVDVKKEFQNIGLLKFLAEEALHDGIANNILYYVALPTSQFSANVIVQHGYSTEEYCEVWRKISVGGEING
jgi:hypothetical protein